MRDEQPEQLDLPSLGRGLWVIVGGVVVLVVVGVVGARLAGSQSGPHKTSSGRAVVAHNPTPHQIGGPISVGPNPENAATAPITPPTAAPTPPTTSSP